MSFTYSSIGLSLGIAQTVADGGFTGIIIGADVTSTQKVWHSLQAFGDIAFAYSFSNILIEIQDTIKAPPPSESKVMQKKATRLSVAATTIFYMLCGCMGYAAFGDAEPDNLLTGFGFYEPFWLLDVANVAIVVHLIGAYQPIFAFVERSAAAAWPDSAFISLHLRLHLLTVLGFYEPFFWLVDIANIATVTPMLLSPACRTIVYIASSQHSGYQPATPGSGTSSMARMPNTGAGRYIGRAEAAVIPGSSHPTPTLTRDGDRSLPPHTITCDWFRIMGSAVISTPDKSCVISAAVMCMAAQYRRFNKKYDGANSWSLEVTAEAVQSLKKMCYERRVWNPRDGATSVEGVLDVIRSLEEGIPTVHDRISLKLKSYESFGQLSPKIITSMLRQKGTMIGALYAGEESYLSSTVYRGNRFALGDRHAVVCTGCRKVNGELCLVIMDNLEREGPFRFVLHEAFEQFHVLTGGR
ncbi:hypothetical protein BDA96_08G062600 [Sorghum bicolor]|uniref:Amino acid transporter transmembrane domain-containing protein n=1 Tax=Sorghum bicolor TaxID=4558 RepID=A0A921U6M0_SORBI|nr:hypothetical protein BDA96_08G062600 [Sorghum bicolor]